MFCFCCEYFFDFHLLIIHLFPQMTTLLLSLRNNLSHPHSILFQIITHIHMALRLWWENSTVLKSGMNTCAKPVQWYLILEFLFLEFLGKKKNLLFLLKLLPYRMRSPDVMVANTWRKPVWESSQRNRSRLGIWM